MSSLRCTLLIGLLVAFFDTKAQGGNRPEIFSNQIAIQASATVVDNLSLVTMRDVNLNSPTSVDGFITVNPVTSPFTGLMRINGRPGRQVRITYLSAETLIEEGGSGGVVKANYRISGFESDNQNASVLLDIGEASVRLSKDGTYFLWLGAVIDVTKAKPGVYVSEFIMEIDGN